MKKKMFLSTTLTIALAGGLALRAFAAATKAGPSSTSTRYDDAISWSSGTDFRFNSAMFKGGRGGTRRWAPPIALSGTY